MLGRVFVFSMLLALPIQQASAQSREEQERLCSNDALRLCGDAVPDEQRIIACMYQKRAQLSPQCRAVFNKSVKPRR